MHEENLISPQRVNQKCHNQSVMEKLSKSHITLTNSQFSAAIVAYVEPVI